MKTSMKREGASGSILTFRRTTNVTGWRSTRWSFDGTMGRVKSGRAADDQGEGKGPRQWTAAELGNAGEVNH